MSYFGGRRDTKQAARDAIVGLRQQLQMIEKKEEHLQKKIDEELKKAKANAVSNKAGTFHVNSAPSKLTFPLTHDMHSGCAGSAAEEGERRRYGSAGGPTPAVGTANQHAGICESECGDDECYEEGFGCACVDPWQHVRISPLTAPITRIVILTPPLPFS